MKGYRKTIMRSTVTFFAGLQQSVRAREAVEHNGRRLICGKPHTMEEAQGS